MRRNIVAVLVIVALVAAMTQGSAGQRAPRAQKGSALKFVADVGAGKAKIPRLPNGLQIPTPSSGVTSAVLEALRPDDEAAALAQAAVPPGTLPKISAYGCRHVFRAPGRPDNVRANVDCGFRWQSEEWVAVNPTDERNIVVSQNDSKLNGNRTGVEFSLNGGRTFGDSVLPNGRVENLDVTGGEYSFDAFSDPVHAYDSRGNLYYSAIGFDAFQTFFGGLFVWKSNSCLKGSALHTPGSGSCRPFEPPIAATAVPIRTNFDNVALFDDKNHMAADYFKNSPHRDNVYATWTIFDFSCGPDEVDYCESPIYFSRSTDGGVTWSRARDISGRNPAICRYGDLFDPDEAPGSCNFSQASYPLVGPRGQIYVVFNNSNTSVRAAVIDGVAQQLMVKSTDGGRTWTKPVRVGRDFQTQPYSIPDDDLLPNGCPDFRPCLPPNGYRADGNHFPSIGIENKTGKLATFWSDFRNGGPCATNNDLGVPIPVAPCRNLDNDVFVSVSNNGGRDWSRPKLVTRGAAGDRGAAAQWQPWGEVGENGDLYVAYYDRQYGRCESTGCNDITLARSRNDGRSWSYRRITTSSMPNLTCEDNPLQCGFLGDYMSTRFWKGTVHMVWGDTRGRGLGFPEEDIYYARVRG